MAVTHTWTCLLLWISTSTQTTTPDTHVTCVFLEDCVLPCSFQPDSDEVIHWLKQEVPVHSFQRGGERTEHEQYAGRTSLFTHLFSRGNASLHLRGCGPRDRGKYKCHVRTSAGMHEAHVIVRVEARIRGLSLELSRLSGYEEVKCTMRHVYPAPHVAWATVPPTAQPLRPITRKLADRQGLYAVESRLRRLNSQPELTYICTVNSSYGSQTWTASLREREINGVEGKDLTIPCHAPSYMPKSSLSWSFTNHNEAALILTYDSQSQLSSASAPWEACAQLDVLRVPLGDGSMQLVNPISLEHTGIYTCVYSSPQNTHTEHTGVNISAVTGEQMRRQEASQWWIFAVVIAVLALALTGILGYLKVRGNQSKPSKRPEGTSEMEPVKDANERGLSESSPLTTGESLSTEYVNTPTLKHVPAAMPETA